MINKIQYKTVGLGGTFDHFHAGHKQFIKFAISFSETLIIGVTNEKMTLGKEYPGSIQPYHLRAQAVRNFCRNEGINARVVELNDPFGPTLEKGKGSVQALACTTDTLKGANKINEVRDKIRLMELPIHIDKLLLDKDGSGPINSSRIRSGEIDRDGNVLASIFRQNLTLTDDQKDFFTRKQGEIVNNADYSGEKICVVGDTTLETFISQQWEYDLGIYDKKKKREKSESEILNSIEKPETVENKAGDITTQLVAKLQTWIKQNSFKHLFVDGEEDLAAVALVLLLPLNSYVYYGQPDEGIVEMKVTEQLKQKFFAALI